MAAEAVDTAPAIPVALEALWTASQLNPQQIPYNEAVAIIKRGRLDLLALRQAFNALVARHEVWHSVVRRVDGVPTLVTLAPPRHALAVLDLSGLDVDAAERQAVRIIAEMAAVPYDIANGPLVRPRLLAMPADEHRLYLGLHHTVFDGVSLYRTIVPELIELYDAAREGRPVALPAPRAGYRDYARWEQAWITSPRAERRLEHWRRRLAPLPPAPSLPLDQPRPDVPQHRGGTVPVELSPATHAALSGVARAAGASAFQVFGAIWAALLHHFSGETDIVFGAPADLRQRSEFASLVGYCLTPVILRIDLSDDPTCFELVRRVRGELLDGLDQLVPFERIVREVSLDASHRGNPIYQTLLTLEPTLQFADPSWSMRLMDSALGDAIGAAKVDLELQLDVGADGAVAGRLIYDRDLFNAATAQRLVTAWESIATAVAADPERRVSALELRTPEDHARLAEFAATSSDRAVSSVLERFVAVAARQPLAPAVSDDAVTLSYAELSAGAADAAARLAGTGVRSGDTVAVCLPPTVELVTGALGVLALGAVPLLLDPAEPVPALAVRAAAAGATVAVIGGDGGGVGATAWARLPTLTLAGAPPQAPGALAVAKLPADALAALHAHLAEPDRVAALSHDAVSTLTDALSTQLGVTAGDTVMALPAMLYSTPSTELWPALTAGARLVLAPAAIETDGQTLRSQIRAEEVTFLHATPARWAALIEGGLGSVRALRALTGGAPLSPELADALRERYRVVWNACAPTLAGGYVALGRVLAEGPITVGRPLDNHRAHVLDAHGRPRPVGFIGDLWVAGPVAEAGDRGAEPAGADPVAATAARPTGLAARWLPDGRLALAERTYPAA
jgi:non-ribosomal peptide synthetase component F